MNCFFTLLALERLAAVARGMALVAGCALCVNANANPLATDTAPPSSESGSPKFEYVLGAGLAVKPDYAGAREYGLAASPIVLLSYGRFTLVGPRGGLARDPGRASETLTGANALLFEGNAFRVNAGLRFDSGRSASDSPELAGLPDIKRRLLYTVGATMDFAPQWSATLRVVSDVKSIKTGSVATLSVGTRGRFTPTTTYYQRAHFGIPEGLPRAPYQPGTSALDATLSGSVRHQLFPHWSVFSTASAGRLLGDAAASPLTLRPVQASVFVGFAYHSVAVR
jgi:outer membrane scaffolding protein for murein synthesis (MipA/OmpV family)